MLETIGYDAAVAASYAPWDAADALVGRVVRVDRGVATVLTEPGPERVTLGGGLLSRMAQDPAATPCVGDWVVVRSWPGHRLTVEHVLPRRTALACPAYGAQQHLIAANCDVAAAVLVAGRRASERDAPRLLEAVRDSGATPVAVLVPARPGADLDPLLEQVGEATEAVRVDIASGAGVDRLRAMTRDYRTLALLAADRGAGDALVQAMAGTSTLHDSSGRDDGLVVLPGGGAVLDLRVPPADPAGRWKADDVGGSAP